MFLAPVFPAAMTLSRIVRLRILLAELFGSSGHISMPLGHL
jgi:hypothetical protein